MSRGVWSALVLCVAGWLAGAPARAAVIVAEGEKFKPLDAKGWKVTGQDDSYGSHSYGGMWMTHGGCLSAPADSVDAVAAQPIQVVEAGKYRVWSKYQAPPYFNYLHKIEVVQGGKTVFSHVYGKKGTDRLWSFSGVSDELWWPWGVDHDSAEAPKNMAQLAAGPAEVRLITVPNVKPAGDRCVDFVLLTTNPNDEYQGFKPYAVGSPFALEALAASKLYLRFQNTSPKPAQLDVSRAGHFQPNYGGETIKVPSKPVGPGAWSEWVNIGPFCRLVHDEGLTVSLTGAAAAIPVQFARDPVGKELVGDIKVVNGEAASVPIDITWRQGATVRASRDIARDLTARAKTWRRANGGKKAKELLFFGSFGSGTEDWVTDLKDAMGYNTLLPDKYEKGARDGLYAHIFGPDEIRKFAATLKDKNRLRVLSFGDEIHLGQINYNDPKMQEKFRAWLARKGVTQQDLGMAPAAAKLTAAGDPRLVWYSNLFNEEERFADYRLNTQVAKEAIGPNVLTGANYSPHTLALCYGPIYQWVDIFKHQGMSMFWAEDYIFSIPEPPQIQSWMLAEARCAVKYHQQPIHFYIMPHAPGQEAGFLRRNMLLTIGCGARHIDSFWVAPQERFTENYVSWNYPGHFQAITEAIFDSAEAEKLQVGGKVRPARVAVVLSKATDFNESRLMIDKAKDPFAARCKNAPDKLNQIICRKDQQMLYLALRQAQHAVDLVTEDDIVELDILKNYDVAYFAGEWIDTRAVPKLDAWVQAGGILYAAAGIGHKNQFDQPEPAMMKLLGLQSCTTTKNVTILRTLLELPLLEPIDTITLDGDKVPAMGMKQTLTPAGAKVLGTWKDGSAAVTAREHGKGKAFAVGSLAGNSYMKTALRVTPWARGGRKMLYNPTDFAPAAERLVRLGVDAKPIPEAVVCSNPHVEGVVLDHPQGTLLTLVNWSNEPLKDLKVTVRLPAKPREARTVSGQKTLPVEYKDGAASFALPLAEADYILLPK